MQYGYGQGFGFRGDSGSWPYFGRGRGGLPRCWYPGLSGALVTTVSYPKFRATGYRLMRTREDELSLLKNQAEMVKSQLKDIESRIQKLGKKE